MRGLPKRLIERVLGSEVALAVARSVGPGRDVILAYHNVIPDGVRIRGDKSLHLPLRQFMEQMEWLRQSFRLVPLTEMLAEAAGQSPRAAVTFDDAYSGAVTEALPALVRRGIPATLFVCTDWRGGESPWWDRLSGNGLSAALRRVALERYGGNSEAICSEAVARGLKLESLPDEFRIASLEDISRVTATPLITIGVHTRSHPNLTRLDNESLRNELEEGLREIQRRYENAISWLAYPYGLSDERVARVTQEAGYSAALRVTGGSFRGRIPDPFSIPRLNVPGGLSLAGLKMRCAGLL